MLPAFRTRRTAAGLSVVSNSVLIALKSTVGVLIGSVAVIAEALHSSIDLLAAIIAFFSLRIAVRPPDATHPFGHGKVEAVSAAVEAGLILFASALIIYEAVHHILEGGGVMGLPDAGIAVMAVSVVANTVVSRHLYAVARATDSLALRADAQHLSTDVVTSLGVMLGLAAVRVTGWDVIDPVAAIAVAVLIVRAAYGMIRQAVGDLVDARLPEAEQRAVEAAITEHVGEVVGFHELRTRRSGADRQIDLHLVFARYITVPVAHRLCDHLEDDIRRRLPNAVVVIHIEPCSERCDECRLDCRPPSASDIGASRF